MWRTPPWGGTRVVARQRNCRRRGPEGPHPRGDTPMFEYELHKIMHAELLRRASLERLAGEAKRSRRE
ncbi:hypothetical protein GTV15_04245, partial [Streptomyces sp. SID7803]|nr:hypothetical protein [Streptomyces sp. SID7803]